MNTLQKQSSLTSDFASSGVYTFSKNAPLNDSLLCNSSPLVVRCLPDGTIFLSSSKTKLEEAYQRKLISTLKRQVA